MPGAHGYSMAIGVPVVAPAYQMTVYKEFIQKDEESGEDRDNAVSRRCCDNSPSLCRANNTSFGAVDIPLALLRTSVPEHARRAINRCSLPPEALASLAFQLGPQALELDGVLPLHRPLFDRLDELADAGARATLFQSYMTAHFLLDDAPASGLSDNARINRSKLDYLRLLRGWLFDSEGREGAILKAWVESRFGLLTAFHRRPLGEPDSAEREAFDHEVATGLYTTCALEAQIDLLYAWAQYELGRRHPGDSHLTLYRGYSGAAALAPLQALPGGGALVQLNNLSSFSASRERADEFGDHVLECRVPLAKVLAFSQLLPGRLQGEDEYLVIGGVAAVSWLS